jgi:hypothetical protein
MRLARRLLRLATARTDESPPGPFGREHVIWAYRLFLSREPESELVVREKLRAHRTVAELRRELVASEEFRAENPELGFFAERNVVQAELEGGVRLYVDLADHGMTLAILRRRFRTAELRFVREIVKPGQTVLDVGAGVGFFTVQMAELVGPAGRVYAYGHLDLLGRSLAENDLGDRVQLMPGGDVRGPVHFARVESGVLGETREILARDGPTVLATLPPDGLIAEMQALGYGCRELSPDSPGSFVFESSGLRIGGTKQ